MTDEHPSPSAATADVASGRIATPTTPPERSGREVARAIALAAGGAGCFMLVHTATFPTLPIYLSLRGASDADIALIIGMIGIVSIAFRPLTGWLIDAWGRRQMMATALLSVAGVAAGYGFAAQLFQLGLFRAVQGMNVGVMNAAVTTYVSDIAPGRRRAEFLGYLNAVQTTATSIGPTLGFAILLWSAPNPMSSLAFWWPDLAAFGGYNFAALFLFLLLTAAVGALLTLLAPAPPRHGGWQPLRWHRLVYRKALAPMLLMVGLTVPFASVLTYLPFSAPSKGLSNVGLYFTCQALGALAAGLTLGRLADRLGRRPVVTAGMIGASAGMGLLAVAPNAAVLLLAGVLSGFSQAGARNGIAAWTADQAPAHERGAALSTSSMGFDIGVSAGSFVLAAIVPAFGITAGWYAAASVPLVGALVAGAVLEDRRPR
ncbi:MAG: MFS transporter [Chloroflexota bacterium]|nr:MFS transporter [Dehalococcoidia bacterium]MDW8252792.1 MFS transporter [Chloroflexota bacterium]